MFLGANKLKKLKVIVITCTLRFISKRFYENFLFSRQITLNTTHLASLVETFLNSRVDNIVFEFLPKKR